jgi:subtilisin family serine protease
MKYFRFLLGLLLAIPLFAQKPADDLGVLVKFKPNSLHSFPEYSLVRTFKNPDLFLVKHAQRSQAEILGFYHGRKDVLYAEPDAQVSILDLVPSDPLFSQQWDMTKIAAPQGWSIQTSAASVIVVVIDTGIDFTHPDLVANLWTGTGGIHGFTCLNGACVSGGQDDFGHGTHVAGTIGAQANNGQGIAGINWQVQLMSMKFLDASGQGLVSDAVVAFEKVAELKRSGLNIRVTNNSWGGISYSQALKDAMAEVEGLGVVDVCAAGNSAANTDLNPMFPGAYDNHGIVSVLASDQFDNGAVFTNYGLATVDVAAPGVETLSTVPIGSCALCDSSGYKKLSGTSMATPHVAGVLAAVFQRFPALTALQARDLLLDPQSLDPVSEARAVQTTTAGRLNLAKALGNPLGAAPRLNSFPTLTALVDTTVTAGSFVSLSPAASDADGDPLHTAFGFVVPNCFFGLLQCQNSVNMERRQVGSFFVPSQAQPTVTQYAASVSDGRGGSAQGSAFLSIIADPLHAGFPPTGNFSITPSSGTLQDYFSFTYPLTDPEGKIVHWSLELSAPNGPSHTFCCFASPGPWSFKFEDYFGETGPYRLTAHAIDEDLNAVAPQTTVIRVGSSSSANPPVAKISADKVSGVAPLTINFSTAGSYSPDGTPITTRLASDFNNAIQPPYCFATAASMPCTFDQPGMYRMESIVWDSNNLYDRASIDIIVFPPGPPPPPDTQPPTMSIVNPASGAILSGIVTITLQASDNVALYTGIVEVDGVNACTFLSPPYSCSWNTTKTANGLHLLKAVVWDTSGNGVVAEITVTVNNVQDTTLPIVSFVTPSNGAVVSGNSVPVSIQASDDVGVTKTEILKDGKLFCSSLSCSWNTKPKNQKGPHTFQANAYDAAGNVGSASITVTAK